MNLPAYPKYKSSGVEWLGDMPAHWQAHRAKWAVSGCFNGVWGDDPDGVDDVICVRVADFDRESLVVVPNPPTVRAIEPRLLRSRRLRRGDLLIEKSGGGEQQLVGRVVSFDHDYQAVCSNFVARMPVRGDLPSRYWCYVHAAMYAGKLNYPAIKQTTGIQNLDADAYLDTPAPFPPENEQQTIAAFLDRETSRLDRLVAKKREMIERLKEKRTALISRTVTRGLPPAVARSAGLPENPPLKQSGVDWLGEIPAHWELKRLRYLCSIETGDKDTIEAIDGGNFPFFVRSQTVERIDSFTFDCEAVLTAGDGVGVGKVFHYFNGKFDVHQRVYVLHNFRGIAGRFLYYYLKEQFYKVALEGSAKSTVDSLRRPMFTDFSVCVPPLSEQAAMVAYLDSTCAGLDSLVGKVEAAVERLQEYRTALITAAVTGKIDVRGRATP